MRRFLLPVVASLPLLTLTPIVEYDVDSLTGKQRFQLALDACQSATAAPEKCAIFGKIQIVDHFPDVKIQKVDAFPDIKVEWVEHFPDSPGKWQKVDHFPDFKVQFVDHFPDYKIEEVTAFPGCD